MVSWLHSVAVVNDGKCYDQGSQESCSLAGVCQERDMMNNGLLWNKKDDFCQQVHCRLPLSLLDWDLVGTERDLHHAGFVIYNFSKVIQGLVQ